MKIKILFLTSILILSFAPLCYAPVPSRGRVEITEEDGSPSTFPYKIKFTNATVMDNGDGTTSINITAGSGDVTSVGDCASGACFDGTSDGGTYISLYDGDSNKYTIQGQDVAGDVVITLPATTGTLIHTESDPTVDTEGEIEAILGVAFGASKVNTAGYIWVADGTDFESVAMSGDVTIASGGATTIADSVTVTGWTMGASVATTPAANDNDTSLATTAWCETTQDYLKTSEYSPGAGGLWLLPESAVLDDNSPPAITIQESTGTGTPRRRYAAFDPSTDEIIYWSFTWQGYTTATVYWMANDIGAGETCYWATQISATTEADADSMAEDACDSADSASEDVNTNEAYRLIKTTITFSNTDSAATDDFITLRFFRDADNGSDDLSSDALLLGVYLE